MESDKYQMTEVLFHSVHYLDLYVDIINYFSVFILKTDFVSYKMLAERRQDYPPVLSEEVSPSSESLEFCCEVILINNELISSTGAQKIVPLVTANL